MDASLRNLMIGGRGMELQGTLRAQARMSYSGFFRRWLPALFLLLVAWSWAGAAMAGPSPFCPPFNVSVAHGGTIILDASACDGPDNFGIGAVETPPLHGTATTEPFLQTVTYTHAGGADVATTDTFIFDDGNDNDVVVTVSIGPASTFVVTTTLNSMTVGVPFNQQLEATGGTGSLTWTVSGGTTLPPGITMTAGGLLSGTPTKRGAHAFEVTATDATPATAVKGFNPTIANPNLVLSPASPPTAGQGVPYSVPFTASGGVAPYSFAHEVVTGALPPGLTLSSTGVLSGTPTTVGSYTFGIRVTDSSTGPGTWFEVETVTLTVTVQIPPVANPVSATVGYNSGANPITLNITGGLPTSVAVATAPAHGTAIASGTSITYQPTAGYAGPDSFTYTATNAAGTSAPATVTITVSAPTVTITPSAPLTGQVGVAFAQTFTFAGGTAPYVNVQVNGLPPGVTVTASTGNSVTLSGTPTDAGSFGIQVQGDDSSTGTGPFSVDQTFTHAIGAPTLSMTPAAGTLNATYGAAYNQAFVASGGIGPYDYGVSAGALPAGLTLSPAGVLSGTPTVTGLFTFSVRAEDTGSGGAGAPFSRTQNYVLQVAAPTIVVDPATLPNGTGGTPYSQTLSASGGIGAYTFSLTAGALPPGMSFSSGGVLSGTPTAAGVFNMTVTATDANGQSGSRAYALTIASPTLSIDPTTLPGGTAGTPYSATLTGSGGASPYSFSLLSGALPVGVSFSSAGVFSGTPVTAGTFNMTVRVTDANGFTADQAYSIVIAAPTIVIDPPALPGGTAGTAYSATLSATGGVSPYSFSLLAGALPVGVSFSSAGVFSGTPTTAGTFNVTVRATDANGFTADHAYSIVIAAPTIVISPASLPGGAVGAPYNQSLGSSGGAAPYSYSIVSGNLPIGVSFSSAGVYSGTPTTTGSYTADIRSTDNNGFSTTVAYTIVIADAVPVAVADSAATLAGSAVTIPVTANDTGIITSIAAASAPAHGTAAVSGLGVVYTPTAGYSGTDTFTYTATGPGGTSAPATVTVTVNPVPIAVSSHVETTAGATVHVDLTAGASGGPFTAATLVSLSPASSGTATIAASGGGYELTFVPATGFAGLATVTFTLSNAYAVSAPATVEILVVGRSDPSKDPEVLGLLAAQASAARRFATSQIGNFQQRLESMHGGDERRAGFQNGITFSAERRCNPNMRNAMGDAECPQTMLRDEDAPVAAPAPMQGESAAQQAPFALWTGGSINRGDRDAATGVSGFDFETSGISAGADFRLNPSFALGGGVGYGRDDTDIGRSGSRSEADSYTVAMYASYHPGERFYLDGLVGYQWMSFDNRRFVTDNGNLVTGERDGTQWFASLSTGVDYRQDRLQVSPYARLDVARATLDRYTERGDAIYALDYRKQDVDTTTTSLGVRLDYRNDVSWGTFSPQFRLEYQHDFQDDGSATMGYADLPAGPLYRALVQGLDSNRIVFGIGAALRTEHDLTFRFEYRGLLGSDGDSDRGILLNLEKKY